jgi:Neuraminidase (sialidase)
VEEESIALYSSEANNNIEDETTLAATGGSVSVETKRNKIAPVYSSVSQTVLLSNRFWFLKITTDPRILSHVNMVSGR